MSKSTRLAIYLIKQEHHTWETTLKDKPYNAYNLNPDLDMEGQLILGKQTQNPPSWLEFINTFTEEPIKGLLNSSNRAILFIKTNGRLFAITFGYGFNMLKDNCYVKDFGLKVALNTLDENRIRTIDGSIQEDLILQTKKQTSKSSSINSFDLDTWRTLIHAVTGEPLDKNLATTITGREALTINTEIDIENLIKKLDTILEKYNSTHYKKNFQWVDNLNLITDKDIIEKLDQELIVAINTQSEKLYLAPPEIIEWDNFEYFSYTPKGQSYQELNIQDFQQQINPQTPQTLKNRKIYIKYTTMETPIKLATAYECHIYETTLGNKNYILCFGKWFQIESTFAEEVFNYIATQIPYSARTLSPCDQDYTEDQYNRELANQSKDLYLLHSLNIKPAGATTNIELCDLFSTTGEFIHIKKRHSSTTLSHLFAQAEISATTFLEDPSLREEAKKKISNKDLDHFFPQEAPQAHNYEILFAIIEKSDKELKEALPFFARLNLMLTTRTLKRMGFKVSMTKIDYKRED